jgi:hypothetical protein
MTLTRWLIALLVFLNVATLAWQWDAFARWGWGPHSAREPERVLNQIRPAGLTIETPAVAAQGLAASSAQTESSAAASPPPEGSVPASPPAPAPAKAP